MNSASSASREFEVRKEFDVSREFGMSSESDVIRKRCADNQPS